MSFKEYAKEKWIKPIIDSLGILTWMAVWMGGTFYFSLTDKFTGIIWTLGYLFFSIFAFFTYWDYRFWKLESINYTEKRS